MYTELSTSSLLILLLSTGEDPALGSVDSSWGGKSHTHELTANCTKPVPSATLESSGWCRGPILQVEEVGPQPTEKHTSPDSRHTSQKLLEEMRLHLGPEQ